jgi:hypothetical protein
MLAQLLLIFQGIAKKILYGTVNKGQKLDLLMIYFLERLISSFIEVREVSKIVKHTLTSNVTVSDWCLAKLPIDWISLIS